MIFKLTKGIFYILYLSGHFTPLQYVYVADAHFGDWIVMIPVDSQSVPAFVHSFAGRHDESCLSSGIAYLVLPV